MAQQRWERLNKEKKAWLEARLRVICNRDSSTSYDIDYLYGPRAEASIAFILFDFYALPLSSLGSLQLAPTQALDDDD